MKNDKKLELFKESALINSEGKFSVVQRNIINAFLFAARKEIKLKLKKENKFFISNQELKSLTSPTGRDNITYAVGALAIIKNTWFRVNIDRKDKSGDWPENFCFLQSYTIFSDGIEFELSNIMFNILNDNKKRPFAILNIAIEKKLSKYAGIVFDFVQDYSNAKTLPFLSIGDLRLRLGAEEKYSQFSDIDKKLKKALKEIKNKTGINLFYSVSRRGRTPVKIKFTQGKRVHLPENHILNQIQEQNQKLTENNMTDSNMNGVHFSAPEPENRIPEISPERVKEILKDFDISRLPVEKQKELIARYGIGEK